MARVPWARLRSSRSTFNGRQKKLELQVDRHGDEPEFRVTGKLNQKARKRLARTEYFITEVFLSWIPCQGVNFEWLISPLRLSLRRLPWSYFSLQVPRVASSDSLPGMRFWRCRVRVTVTSLNLRPQGVKSRCYLFRTVTCLPRRRLIKSKLKLMQK